MKKHGKTHGTRTCSTSPGPQNNCDRIVKEHRAKNQKVQLARVYGVCCENGNQVKRQNFEAALFQDLVNLPATFAASRRADGNFPITQFTPVKHTFTDAWPDVVLARTKRLGLRRPSRVILGNLACKILPRYHVDPDVKARRTARLYDRCRLTTFGVVILCLEPGNLVRDEGVNVS